MNLTILLALAFGAITGLEMPVARVRTSVAACESRASEKAVRAARLTTFRRRARSARTRLITRAAILVEVPLAGAATPRAPATIG
jgi:hypothetical protein